MKGFTEINLPYGPIYSDEEEDSFTFRKLNRPGTLIKMKGDKKIYLIGDINPLRGVCDDCTQFRKEKIVECYKVLVIPLD